MGTLDGLLQDLRIAIRTLTRNRGSSFSAIATLALGIGATTVMFSVVYSLRFEPFIYKDSERLVMFTVDDLGKNGFNRSWLYIPEFAAVREQNKSFEDLIGYRPAELAYRNNSGTRNILGGFVTVNSFEFLAVRPLLGRGIQPADGESDAEPVFVMNYGMWKRNFGSDPGILGKTFILNNRPRMLVGIMPPQFQFVSGAEVWLPLSLRPGAEGQLNVANLPIGLMSIGRLRPGATLHTAAADLNFVFSRLAKLPVARPYLTYPANFTVTTETLRDRLTGNFKGTLYTLLGAVTVLLLIACTNVSSLLLVQATKRRREIAIRSAIGASRSRLVRQLIVESSVISFVACVVGSILAYAGLNLVRAFLPPDAIPSETALNFQPAVLLFSLFVASLTTILCGLAPALFAIHGELYSHLATGSKNSDGGDARGKLRAGLVIAEVALSVILLAGAGLMARTLLALTHVDVGFDSNRLLYAKITLPKEKYAADQKKIFFRELIDRVTTIPGVAAAGTTAMLPTTGGAFPNIRVRGSESSVLRNGMWDLASPGYFQTMNLRLVRGRILSESDIESGRYVAVVNQTLARAYFGDADPIGHAIQVNSLNLLADAPKDAYFEIIGVVTDFNNTGLREAVAPEAFLPYTFTGAGDRTIVVRTLGDPNSVLKSVVHAIGEIDPNASVGDTASFAQMLQTENSYPRFESIIFGAFATLGMILVAFGIFSVMAYTVSLQTRNIGIRMALGADRAHIIRRVLNSGLALISFGTIVGTLTALALTRLIASHIWGVSTQDPLTFSAASVLMLVIGLLGSLFPARRASQVDPMVVLRHE